MVRYSRRQFALAALASVAGLSASGCGTLMYPERRGQPKGQLDWGVVGLDGLGLILFLVPGIVAFAVDFYTGAIYLPPDSEPGFSDSRRKTPDEFTVVRVASEELTDERISAVITEHTGRQVDLSSAHCRREPLAGLQQFWGTHDRVVAELHVRSLNEPDVLRAQSR